VKSRLLWVGDTPVPQNVRDATRQNGQLDVYRADEPLAQQLDQAAIALVCPNGRSDDAQWVGGILKELQRGSVLGVFLLTACDDEIHRTLARHKGPVLTVDRDIPTEQLAAQLAVAAAMQPLVHQLQSQLSDARRLGARATRTIEEMDEEMRLAARLQRDFLPRRLPDVGSARFGVLYRPAGWVSGDIYDVVRLDETHVGFYVADVVGHGMPAALLTMFIKKALQTKRIVGHSYEIVPPEISLKELNADICEQDLPSCQFCTAVYCVLDVQALQLTFARGGHPEPIVIHPNGQIERLWCEGSLLGIFADEEYACAQYQLNHGDRLVLYTDGAEEALGRQPSGELLTMEAVVSNWVNLSREELLLRTTVELEARWQDASPKDDVTVMVLDIEG